MAAYLYFYNPVRFLWALVRPKSNLYLADSIMQVAGMSGLAQTIRRTIGWAFRLTRGKIERHSAVPRSRLPIRRLDLSEMTPPPASNEAPSRRLMVLNQSA